MVVNSGDVVWVVVGSGDVVWVVINSGDVVWMVINSGSVVWVAFDSGDVMWVDARHSRCYVFVVLLNKNYHVRPTAAFQEQEQAHHIKAKCQDG